MRKRLIGPKTALFGGTAIALSYVFVNSYIDNHSGCFFETTNQTCKINELSCCNQKPSETIESCPPEILERLKIVKDGCFNFDISKSCCDRCSCKHHTCNNAKEKMYCHQADVAEALSSFVHNIPSTIGEKIFDLLNSPFIIKIFIFIVICILFVFIIVKII